MHNLWSNTFILFILSITTVDASRVKIDPKTSIKSTNSGLSNGEEWSSKNVRPKIISKKMSNLRGHKIRPDGGEPLIKTDYSYVGESKSLRSFLIEDIGISETNLDQNGLYQRIKSDNRALNEFYLVKGDEIYLELPAKLVLSPMSKSAGAPKVAKEIVEKNTIEESIKPKKKVIAKKDRKLHLSGFYTASVGTFSEKLASGAALSSQQNSPFSVGLAGFYDKDKKSSYSSSLYLSYLNGAASSGSAVEIPPELGGNFYYDRRTSFLVDSLYGGIDIERFSTFNTDEIPLGEVLSTRQHNIVYATFGTTNFFRFWGMKAMFKLSLAKSLIVKSSRASLASDKSFSGLRILAYLNARKNKSKWFYHSILKYHQMDGPTQLAISRFGVGLGYSFF